MAHLLQDPEEFNKFCQLLVTENVKSYLEIGSFSGGSLEQVAKVLPKGSRIVSVDKPWNSVKQARLHEVIRQLKKSDFDSHLITGDSTDLKVVAAAQKLGPYDAVFIDGDHRLSYVKSDWDNYGVIGRIVGFHDIARDMPKDQHGGPHQVFSFWQSFKNDHKYVEFISTKTLTRTDTALGIGVVWNASKAVYGIGVVWNESGPQVQQVAGAGSA